MRKAKAIPLPLPPDVLERFYSHVDTNGPVPEKRPELGPCHVWIGYIPKDGYPMFRLRRMPFLAHRISYALVNGNPIPELDVHHQCENKKCVNTEHLEAVNRRAHIFMGSGFAALNARKKLCQRGHPLSPPNAHGSRRCLECPKLRRLEKSRARFADRVPIACRTCTRPFLPTLKNIQKFCSGACRSKHRRLNLNPRVTTCIGCGCDFMRTDGTGSFHSRECLAEFRRRMMRSNFRHAKRKKLESEVRDAIRKGLIEVPLEYRGVDGLPVSRQVNEDGTLLPHTHRTISPSPTLGGALL
jgi:HNH endonuclease